MGSRQKRSFIQADDMKRYGIIHQNFRFDIQRFADLSSLQTDLDGAYLISSVADLEALATYVNDGGTTEDFTFKLTADITFADGEMYTTIDTVTVNSNGGAEVQNLFAGTFDGNGKTITGLKIDSSKTSRSTAALPSSTSRRTANLRSSAAWWTTRKRLHRCCTSLAISTIWGGSARSRPFFFSIDDDQLTSKAFSI